MHRPLIRFFLVLSLTPLIGLKTTSSFLAESTHRPFTAATPFDLINAVNTLRASYGLAPYSINSILMETAQSQADFMAATEDVSHVGPDGIGLTDRLLAAGYPLAGDLSAGGFRAENITSGNESSTAQSAVESWTGDALHLNTMISPNLSEIGAGVAISNGRVYYVIDCALPTIDGLPQPSIAIAESGSTGERITVPTVIIPNSSGDVSHEVQPAAVPGSPTPNLLPTVTIIYEVPSAAPVMGNSVIGIAISMIALALLGGGIFTWLGRNKKTKD